MKLRKGREVQQPNGMKRGIGISKYTAAVAAAAFSNGAYKLALTRAVHLAVLSEPLQANYGIPVHCWLAAI